MVLKWMEDFPEKLNQLIELRSDQVESTKEFFCFDGIRVSYSLWVPFWQMVIKPVQLFGSLDYFVLMLPLLKTQMRVRDLITECRQCGAAALPIVTLISFLTGLTMAFVGSVQLENLMPKFT